MAAAVLIPKQRAEIVHGHGEIVRKEDVFVYGALAGGRGDGCHNAGRNTGGVGRAPGSACGQYCLSPETCFCSILGGKQACRSEDSCWGCVRVMA